MTLLLKSMVFRETSYTSVLHFSHALSILKKNTNKQNLKFKVQIVRKAYPNVRFLPVALVPSIRRSYILTELSEHPTAR